MSEKDTYTCSGCTLINPISVEKCGACEKQNPMAPQIQGLWSCQHCTFLNKPVVPKCDMCGGRNPSIATQEQKKIGPSFQERVLIVRQLFEKLQVEIKVVIANQTFESRQQYRKLKELLEREGLIVLDALELPGEHGSPERQEARKQRKELIVAIDSTLDNLRILYDQVSSYIPETKPKTSISDLGDTTTNSVSSLHSTIKAASSTANSQSLYDSKDSIGGGVLVNYDSNIASFQAEQIDRSTSDMKQIDLDNSKRKTFSDLKLVSQEVYFSAMTTPMHKIQNGLYLGSQGQAGGFEFERPQRLAELKNRNIARIMCCADNTVYEVFKDDGIEYIRFPINSNSDKDIKNYLHAGIEYIHETISAGKNMLVHCNSGLNRSAGFVIAYLMQFEKLTYFEALQKVYAKRPCIKPSEGVEKQLLNFEDELLLSRSNAGESLQEEEA